MHTYVLRRLLLAVPVIFAITLIIFLAMRVMPGDPLTVMFGQDGLNTLSNADRERIEASLGLRDPLYVQYASWLKDIFTLELGHSFWRSDSVMDLIKRRGPISAEIAVLAILLSWLIGLPVGILGAIKQNSAMDYVSRFSTITFLAIPNFWFAALISLGLLLWLRWRPPLELYNLWVDPWKNLQIIWGPVLVLGLGQAAYIARLTRTTLLEVIHEDYVRTARAKGLPEKLVILRHALQNAILPVITFSGVLLGVLLGGSVVVERAFGVPGLGRTLIQAYNERDFVVMQNLVFLYGLIFVVVNLLVDLSYAWLDPRIRYK
jgi:peptide/nickel transport system permease protein